MDWATLQFYAVMRPAFQQLVRTEADRRDPAQIEEALAKTETYVAILDQHLADRKFVNGAHFSMADICLGVIAHRWMGLPAKRVSHLHLERWYRSIRERKAARKILVLPLR
jgi:glutathione S-transferase